MAGTVGDRVGLLLGAFVAAAVPAAAASVVKPVLLRVVEAVGAGAMAEACRFVV